jgi:hypothetical protein
MRGHHKIGSVAIVCLIIGGAAPKLGELIVEDMYPWAKQHVREALAPPDVYDETFTPDPGYTLYKYVGSYVSAPIKRKAAR